jgi:ABC-type sulfate transport system substrate-binding protein
MALVAGVAGSKKENGQRFTASDFFPSLAEQAPISIDEARAARLARGLDSQAGGGNVIAGWERWALMCRQVASRRQRGA